MSFVTFGTGFRPDTLLLPESLFPGLTHHDLLGTGSLPDAVSNDRYVDAIGGIRSQGRGNACVAFELLANLGMDLAANGYAGSCVFAPRLAYWGARAYGAKLMNLPKGTILQDNGTAPSFCVAACNDIGVALEEADPYDDTALVGDHETLRAASDAAPRIPVVFGAFTALEEPAGPTRTQAIKQAIAQPGGRVSLSIFAGPNFTANDGSQVLEPDEGIDNHYVGVYAYFTVIAFANGIATVVWIDPNGDLTTLALPCPKGASVGDTLFGLSNQWSIAWGAKCPLRPGTAIVHERFTNASNFLYLCRSKFRP